MLSITPLHYSRWKHMEKYYEGEKTSDEVMNRMCLYTSIYNIVWLININRKALAIDRAYW